MQNMSVARRRRERTDSAEYSDASYEDNDHINSGEEDEGDSEYDSVEHSDSDDLSERESGDGQAAPGSQKEVDHDEDRRNPQYIPKRGTFYEHDDRTAISEEEGKVAEDNEGVLKISNTGGEVVKSPSVVKPGSVGTPTVGGERKQKPNRASADRWTHDKFNENDQAPKSSEELVSIYGYDIRAEEGPPRAFRRRKYGRGPNKYTRNWEDEKAYSGKTPTPKKPPQVSNGEEFPSLQSTNERKRGGPERRRNGTSQNVPKKTIEVVTPKKQEMDRNANNTKLSSQPPSSEYQGSGGRGEGKGAPEGGATVPKQRTAGTGRVGLVAPGPLRRPYAAENKENVQKEISSPIQKISVPPSEGLPSASLGGSVDKKLPSVKKPSATALPPPRMQAPTVQQAPPTTIPTTQQQQQQPQIPTVNNNNIALSASSRASPPQLANVQSAQMSAQVTEVSSGRGKRYSSIRQRPMPEQYQPVQYIADYQAPPPGQQTQQQATQVQQQIPATITSIPHRQTPPPQQQQILQTQQMQQQLHQKTPPPTHTMQHAQAIHQTMQPAQPIHQTNPNLIQPTQHTQSVHQTTTNIHQPSQQLHQINPSIQQLHQVSPTLHQASTSVHQSSTPQMLPPNPPIHQTSPSIHQSNPQMLQSSTNLHPPASNIIQGQQLHQQSTTIHQPSPTLHQTTPPLHQSNQPILQNSPQIHQVSPPLQTPMGRQSSGPAVNPLPMRQVQRSHQQMPIHNIPTPAHIQSSIPQQGIVASQNYPTQPMIPQTQYMQNNTSGIYSHTPHNIAQVAQVYQPPQGYVAPPPMPYHHQPTPPPPYSGRSVYREPSGITFYSPQEQKGASAPPPTRRPTNAIPIVPPPSRKDREKLSDAAAVQKDNIDHIVDNMFVPRHQQPRNAARPIEASKTTEPVPAQPDVASEDRNKDGSGDKSSKETSVEPIPHAPVSESHSDNTTSVLEDVQNTVVESLAGEVSEKLTLETNVEPEHEVIQESFSEECGNSEAQPVQEVESLAQVIECETIATELPSDDAIVVSSETTPVEIPSDNVEQVPQADVIKDTVAVEEPSGVQEIPIVDEQKAAVVETETVVEEANVDMPKNIVVEEAEKVVDIDKVIEEQSSTEAAE